MAIAIELSSPLLGSQVEEESRDGQHQHKYQARYHSKLTNMRIHFNKTINKKFMKYNNLPCQVSQLIELLLDIIFANGRGL